MNNLESFYKKHGMWEILVGVSGLVGTPLTIIYGSVPQSHQPLVVTLILSGTVIVILLIQILFLNQKISDETSTRAKIEEGLRKPTPRHTRFEEVKKSIKKIEYGFVQYSPFFWINDLKCPDGIGYEVLKYVLKDFGPDFLSQHQYKGRKDGNNWKNVFSDLCKKEFDIVLTPLFETRSRIFSYNIAYCSPLFFSNIGIYVRESVNSKPNSMKFQEAIEFVRSKAEQSSWKPGYIPGELSEIMLKKHGFNHLLEEDSEEYKIPATDNDFYKVLKNISDDNGSSFVFMEVFKANSIINRFSDVKVKNILIDNELMYPVSFVVRKEDTAIRNIINLRLMEMRENKANDSSQIKKAAKSANVQIEDDLSEIEGIIKIQAVKAGIKDDEFEDIFVQKYDFKRIS